MMSRWPRWRLDVYKRQAMVGPNTGMCSARQASARPAAKAASGPTTTSSICSCLAKSTNSGILLASIGTFLPICCVPGLPGAISSSLKSGDCAIFQARACSRPPEPTNKTFTIALLLPD